MSVAVISAISAADDAITSAATSPEDQQRRISDVYTAHFVAAFSVVLLFLLAGNASTAELCCTAFMTREKPSQKATLLTSSTA